MIRLRFLIKYYMLSFLLIDSLSGFIRIYLGISNPLFNVGYWEILSCSKTTTDSDPAGFSFLERVMGMPD